MRKTCKHNNPSIFSIYCLDSWKRWRECKKEGSDITCKSVATRVTFNSIFFLLNSSAERVLTESYGSDSIFINEGADSKIRMIQENMSDISMFGSMSSIAETSVLLNIKLIPNTSRWILVNEQFFRESCYLVFSP